MSARRAWLLWLSLTSACTYASDLTMTVPPVDGGQSYLVVFRQGPDAIVVAGDEAHPVELSQSEPDRTLYLLIYADSLDTLGLDPGSVAADRLTDISTDCPLATRLASYVSRVRNGAASAWVAAPLPEDLERALSPDPLCAPCTDFDKVLSEPLEDTPTFSTWLESGEALIGFDGSGGWRAAAPEGLSETITDCPGSVFNALPLGNDRFWVSGYEDVKRVKVDRASGRCEIETVVSLPAEEIGRRTTLFSIERIPDIDPNDGFYTMSSTGTVFRFADQQWTRLLALPLPQGETASDKGGLATSNEQTWATFGDLDVYDLGITPPRPQTVPRSDQSVEDQITAIGSAPGRGLLVGTNIGRLVERTGPNTWTERFKPEGGISGLAAIRAFRGGLVVVHEGRMTQLGRDGRACEPIYAGGGIREAERAPLVRDDLLLFRQILFKESGSRQLVWLVPVERP